MPRRPRRKKTYDELISSYYGSAPHAGAPARTRARAQSLGHDDGEVLVQRRNGAGEHIVHATAADIVAEYVVVPVPAPDKGSPTEEILPPAAASSEELPVIDVTPREPPLGAAVSPPPAERMPAPSRPQVDGMPAPSPPPQVEGVPAPFPPPSDPAAATRSVDEDELAADMQAILSGDKVYDPASGRTVPRGQVSRPPTSEPPPRPAVAADDQAIFDRIAHSMRYANAYDLGTVELENRFADFDRLDDLAQRGRAAKRAGASQPRSSQPPKVGGADFLEDLEALHARDETDDPEVRETMAAIGRAASVAIHTGDRGCGPSALNVGVAASAREYATPMYDAGEHVLAGGDQYKDALRVGQAPGVLFSYGELIAMGDLYETSGQMASAPVAELTKLKELISRSARYYAGKQVGNTDDALDVSHTEWDNATGKRYRRLADDNSEHFAPDVLFSTGDHRNHKTAWQQYHRMAIAEAQRVARLPENQNRSYTPESALIINAFGDHFLTDAFAAGHLVNKDAVMQKFRANFYSGSKLNSDGHAFFKRVADKAFTGDVRRRFEVLEERRTRCFKHWNIDTTKAFIKLLVGIAEQAPEKVSNIAAKALHDRLNSGGVEVTNATGRGPWHLMGDGALTAETLAVMTEAVAQSIANINDPAILATNVNFLPFFEKVWKYTPQLTPSSRAEVIRLVGEYTNPASTVLSDAAAELISRPSTLDLLIDELVNERKILQHE